MPARGNRIMGRDGRMIARRTDQKGVLRLIPQPQGRKIPEPARTFPRREPVEPTPAVRRYRLSR